MISGLRLTCGSSSSGEPVAAKISLTPRSR